MAIEPITRKEKFLAKAGGQQVGDLKPITREEMFLQKIAENGGGSGGGVQPDLSQNDPNAPDYVKNRTHYVGTTVVNEPLNITWDGNTEGLVSSSDGWLYKISDAVLNDEQIKSVTITSKGGSILLLSVMWDGLIVTEDVVSSEVIAFCRKDGASDGYCTYPEAGIYTIAGTGLNCLTSLTTTEPVEHTKTVIKKLDKKFLPDVSDLDANWIAALKAALAES